MHNVSNIYEYFVYIGLFIQFSYLFVIFSLLHESENSLKTPSPPTRLICLERDGDLLDAIFLGVSASEGYVAAEFEIIERVLVEFSVDSSEGQQILTTLNPGLIGRRIVLGKFDGELRIQTKSEREAI